MLCREPSARLGCGAAARGGREGIDYEDVQRHPFFTAQAGHFDFQALYDRTMPSLSLNQPSVSRRRS